MFGSAQRTQKHFRAVVMAMVTLLVVLTAMLVKRAPQRAATETSAPLVTEDLQHDLSPRLADMATHYIPSGRRPDAESEEAPHVGSSAAARAAARRHPGPSPAISTTANPFSIVTAFEGISTNDLNANGLGVYNFATDSSGAIGPNHYVQTVNFAYAVYDRTGNRLLGPVPTGALWSGFNPACGGDWSDVVVLYDKDADRWFISRFASDGTNPTTTNSPYGGKWYQCFAISQTPDPTGAYYRYIFAISSDTFNDYPKFGIWRDAYYMTADRNKIFAALGMFVLAFERDKMLQGAAARKLEFFVNNGGFRAGMLPADWEGDRRPPDDAPNYLVRPTAVSLGWPADSLEVWEFKADWHNPSVSTLTRTDVLTPPAYESPCGTNQDCIPQPGTSEGLDPLAYGYLMSRLSYRRFDHHQSLLLNYTVEIGDQLPNPHAGVRWFELRKHDDKPWSIHQQGDYAPDSDNRWIGSVAQDRYGNIAVGYDVSGPTRYPSIAFAGRLERDPLGTMSKETTIQSGGGSQTGYPFWGDYSQMTIDPTDDCTFWYVNTYQPSTTSNQGWGTHIASFRSEECAVREHNQPPPQGNFALSASPTNLTVTPNAAATTTVTITPENGFSGNVNLSATGLPTGVVASFNTNPATTTSTLNLSEGSTIPPGTFTVTIVGTSGSLTNAITVLLTISP